MCKSLLYQKVFNEVFALFEFFAISGRRESKKMPLKNITTAKKSKTKLQNTEIFL